MEANPLSIEGVWSFTPILRPDDRGVFLESFKASVLEETVGHSFDLQQMNISMYVQCFSGRILDVVVDIRVGSPTFGQWDAIELDDQTRTGLYISEGLGHAFCALTDSVTVGYLCSEPYAPTREHGIHPLDPELGLPWPEGQTVMSPKDAAAPTLAEAMASGLLPQYDECRSYIASLIKK